MRALICEALEQLKENKRTIRGFHGLGMPEQAEKNLWTIYEGQAPEMKRLTASIDKLETWLNEDGNKPRDKPIEELADEDLLELWSIIGGAPHLFEYGKEDLRLLLVTGEAEDHGFKLDYYTMAAIVDTLRKRGFPYPVGEGPGL